MILCKLGLRAGFANDDAMARSKRAQGFARRGSAAFRFPLSQRARARLPELQLLRDGHACNLAGDGLCATSFHRRFIATQSKLYNGLCRLPAPLSFDLLEMRILDSLRWIANVFQNQFVLQPIAKIVHVL